MKIAFVSTSLARVGPVFVMLDIINSLPSDCEIDIFYLDDLVEIKVPDHVRLIKINFFSHVDFAAYDVVHSHMMRADFFCSIRRYSIRKLVSTMHSNFKVDLKISHGIILAYIFSYLWVAALKRFDNLVFLTKSQLKNFPELSPIATVIHNGRSVPLSCSGIEVSENLADDGFLKIGACAHVVKRKGFDQVIKMLALNGAENIKFLLVGSGPELQSLENLASHLGVRDRFITLGHKDDIVPFIRLFDAYVMTSHSEGMPLALLEAAACQCPIICSDIDVVKEIFTEDEVTFYEIDNISSLLDSVNKTLQRRQVQSLKAYTKYRDLYTPDAMAAKYWSIYYCDGSMNREY